MVTKSKRRNFYIPDEAILDKYDKTENKSQLITQLLTDYFNKDLDYLEAEKQVLSEKITINQSRIDNLLKLQRKTDKLKAEKLELEKQADENNKLLNDVLTYWKNGKISDKAYFSLFKGGKLNKSKARKLL